MAASANEPTRSPKRAHDELDGLVESASKRSKTASPAENDSVAERNGGGGDDKDDGLTAATSGAQEGQEGDGARGVETARQTQPQDPTTESTAPAAPAPPKPESDETATTTEARTAAAAPQTKMCGVCHEKEGKYKCTRCALPFCSVPCNKIHRENHPPVPEPAAKPPPPPPVADDASSRPSGGRAPARDPNNPFAVLDDSDQLRYLFRRYPGLQARLLNIIAATEPPPDAAASSSGGGGSLNDVMKARAMAAANPRKERWTHDVGIRNGKEALRKARNAAGEDGEGVREYIELINHLVSRGADESADADKVIRRRATEKDTELIRRLMAEDRG